MRGGVGGGGGGLTALAHGVLWALYTVHLQSLTQHMVIIVPQFHSDIIDLTLIAVAARRDGYRAPNVPVHFI